MSELGTTDPLQCCRCHGPVGVVIEVRNPDIAEMFTCRGSNWHGSWHYDATRNDKRPVLHIICDVCESSLKVQYERDLIAEAFSYVTSKNQRLEVYTRAPTMLMHQALEIIDRLYKAPGERR